MACVHRRANLVGKLQTHAQYEKVLQQSTTVSNSYFVLHYRENELSTQGCISNSDSVDNFLQPAHRLGLIVPKRWAKRAVTRSLVKRQCRVLFIQGFEPLPAGDWVIRLRKSLNDSPWVSASSQVLKLHIRQELRHLMKKAGQRWVKMS